MTSSLGAAVVHGKAAYFSQGRNVYSYTLARDEWTELQKCGYERFALAVINNKVTTIGGWSDDIAINTLTSWHGGGLFGWGTVWRELFPPMPTARVKPATVTTSTHLIVAGGMTRLCGGALSITEIFDTNTLQWSSARCTPKALKYPCMSLCGEHLYLSQHNTVFSCSIEEILKSCKPATTSSSDGGGVWSKLENIPVSSYWTVLTTLHEGKNPRHRGQCQ